MEPLLIIDLLLVIVGSLGLIIGTITDFQKREVADWINFSLIFTGIGFRAIYATLYHDYWFLVLGVLWLILAYLFGLIMYYSGQWGGGDCKMIMGLGALFGTTPVFFSQSSDVIAMFFPQVSETILHNSSFMLHFLFNAFLVGSVYGIIWVFVLVFLHFKDFRKSFGSMLSDKSAKWGIVAGVFLFVCGYLVLLFHGIWDIVLQLILLMILIVPFLLLFIRAVEKSCMIKMMKISDLTEGEWIVDDVIMDGKYITGPKELGISYEQIQKLVKLNKAGKIDSVKVKIGIPFVPAFLIAFIVTAVFGNILMLIL